jgi:hypothetical protein
MTVIFMAKVLYCQNFTLESKQDLKNLSLLTFMKKDNVY